MIAALVLVATLYDCTRQQVHIEIVGHSEASLEDLCAAAVRAISAEKLTLRYDLEWGLCTDWECISITDCDTQAAIIADFHPDGDYTVRIRCQSKTWDKITPKTEERCLTTGTRPQRYLDSQRRIARALAAVSKN